jgi:hypothetical protein
MAVAHMGENGTIDSYEMDQEAIDLYKDRAIGKLLNVAISDGKTPDSKTVDIYLGEFTDYGSFSERAKKYLNYTGNKTFRYTLYEVLSDGTGIASVLCPRIPLIDKDGRPVRIGKEDQFSDNDLGQVKETYYVERGYSKRVGWTYLFKKAGFKYKMLMSDLSETVSDFHPYLYNELKIGITPEAMKRINALMAYIRGELENPGESLSWMNEGFGLSDKDIDKFKDIHDKILESGKDKAREALGVTDEKIKQSISDWQSGKNKDNYVTYTNDDGSKYVIDSTLGVKIAEMPVNGKMVALSLEKINEQTGEDYTRYIRQSDLVRGRGQTDFESLYRNYMEDDIHNLSESDVRSEFIKRMSGREGGIVREHGKEWKTFVDESGNIRYKRDIKATEVAAELEGYLEKAKEALGTINTDEIRRKLSEGLTAAEFKNLTGIFAKTEGPKWDDLESVRRYYAGFGEDVSDIWKGSKTNIALQKSWLKENSDNRKLADALIAKYNERGGQDTDDLYNSNGTLVYRDDAGMVHALGKVETNESGFNVASEYGNTGEGAKLYANANEAFTNLNMGTEAGQALLEGEYAAKYGAKSLGGGRMMIEHDGERIVFNVNKVGRHASITDIINSEGAKFYRNSRSSDEQNQAADEVFGNESGWSEIVLKQHKMKAGGEYGGYEYTVTEDSDARAREHLSAAMKEALDKYQNSDEAQKQLQFREAYNTAALGLSQERLSKIESGSVDEKMEGHAGNIEDYTKRSADYLEIIAGAVVEDDGDKKKLDDLKQLKLPESQLERRAFGPVTKEDVNKVTEEVKKNSKDYFVSLLVPEMKKLAEQYKDDLKVTNKDIFLQAKKNILGREGMQNSEGKMFGFGGWSAGIISKARQKQEIAETKAKAENTKADAANIKAKKEIQKVEATVVKTQSETTKIQETTVKKTAEVVKQQEQNAEEERKQLEKRAEMMSKTETHQFDLMKGLAGNLGGEQKVIYNQEGSNVTINVYNRSGFDPIAYSK